MSRAFIICLLWIVMSEHCSRLREFETYLFVDQKLASSTKKRVRLTATKLFEYYDTHGQTRDSLNSYILKLQEQGRRNGTLNIIIGLAKHYDRFTGKNILTDLKYFKQESFYTEPLTPTEIKTLAECDRHYSRRDRYLRSFYKALIYFLALTGCRIEEALSLTKQYVKGSSVIFMTTKNGESRQVPVPAWLVVKMLRLSSKSIVFPSITGGQINSTTVRNELHVRARLIGLKKPCYPHVFRHSFITQMIKEKVPIMYIARIVGHKDLKSTDHYTRLVMADLEEAQNCHPLLRDKMTFEEMTAKVKRYIASSIITNLCKLSITETAKSLAIQIEKA